METLYLIFLTVSGGRELMVLREEGDVRRVRWICSLCIHCYVGSIRVWHLLPCIPTVLHFSRSVQCSVRVDRAYRKSLSSWYVMTCYVHNSVHRLHCFNDFAGREIRERLDEHVAQLYSDLDGGFSHLAWLLPTWVPLPSFKCVIITAWSCSDAPL